jgi:hypothetical protein
VLGIFINKELILVDQYEIRKEVEKFKEALKKRNEK